MVEVGRREEGPGGGAEKCMALALTAITLLIQGSIRTFSQFAQNAGRDSEALVT